MRTTTSVHTGERAKAAESGDFRQVHAPAKMICDFFVPFGTKPCGALCPVEIF